MLSYSYRILSTVEHSSCRAARPAPPSAEPHRHQPRLKPAEDCIAITLQRHHLPPGSIVRHSIPGPSASTRMGIAEDLRTAVINVLDNAVKYFPRRAFTSVARWPSPRYTWIELTITDTGVGLPSNQFKRIFNRFYRVLAACMAKIKGTGLGLFLVRNIARQHGGDATANSLLPWPRRHDHHHAPLGRPRSVVFTITSKRRSIVTPPTSPHVQSPLQSQLAQAPTS